MPNPVREAKRGLWWLCILDSVTWQKITKQKFKEYFHCIEGSLHIFGPIIQIWMDCGHMYFWSSGQSISLTLI
jgi:hypothetical protein